jgi:hypothetical protein
MRGIECACTGTCQQITPAPFIEATTKDYLVALGYLLIAWAIGSSIAYWALSEANHQFAIQDKINQESSVSWRK